MVQDDLLWHNRSLYYEPTVPDNRTRPGRTPSYYDSNDARTEPIGTQGSGTLPPALPPQSFGNGGGDGSDPSRQRNRLIAIALIGSAVIIAIIVTYQLRSHIMPPMLTPIPIGTTASSGPIGTMTALVTMTPRATTTMVAPTVTVASACAGYTMVPTTNSSTFATVRFPAGTTIQASQDSEVDGRQYRDIAACSLRGSTTASITTAYAEANTSAGWVTTTVGAEPAAGAGCTGDLCLRFTDTATLGVLIKEYLTVMRVQSTANATIYQLRLTIAPLFAGTATLTKGSTFSFEGVALNDMDWSLGDAIKKGANTALAELPSTLTYATATYQQISNQAINTLKIVPQTVGSTTVLKDSRGHYGKFIIQEATATTITFAYIIYGFGF